MVRNSLTVQYYGVGQREIRRDLKRFVADKSNMSDRIVDTYDNMLLTSQSLSTELDRESRLPRI